MPTGGADRDGQGGEVWTGSLLLPLAVILLFALVIIAVDPRGEFPLDDDWSFTLSTWHFARTGEFVLARFSAMSLRLQILWGAIWTWLFGSSHEVLRSSTLFLSASSLILFERLLRRGGVSSGWRSLLILALLFHPIFLWASFTYMTQVPFLFCTLAAFYFFFRGLSEDDLRLMTAGALAVVAAYFIRQTGVAGALAPLTMLVRYRSRISPRWPRLAAISASPILIFPPLYFLTPWLSGNREQMQEHYRLWGGNAAEVLLRAASSLGEIVARNIQFGALFLLPLCLALLLAPRIRDRRFQAAALLVFLPFAGYSAWMIGSRQPFPYLTGGNVLVNFGLGPLTLRDTWTLGYRYPFHLGETALSASTYLVSALGAVTVASVLFRWFEDGTLSGRDLLFRLAALHALFATLILLPGGFYFDRYALDSLWPLIPALALTIPEGKGSVRVVVGAATFVLAFFSVGATQEYLDWNRARWIGYRSLREAGVTLQQMDGGFEINQYLIGGFSGNEHLVLSGMSVIDDEYILAFNTVRGYEVLAAYPYRGFFGLRRGEVLVEKRVKLPGIEPKRGRDQVVSHAGSGS